MSGSQLPVSCPQCGALMSFRSQNEINKKGKMWTVKKYECEVCGQIDYLHANGENDIGNNKDFKTPPKTNHNSFDDDNSSHIN